MHTSPHCLSCPAMALTEVSSSSLGTKPMSSVQEIQHANNFPVFPFPESISILGIVLPFWGVNE